LTFRKIFKNSGWYCRITKGGFIIALQVDGQAIENMPQDSCLDPKEDITLHIFMDTGLGLAKAVNCCRKFEFKLDFKYYMYKLDTENILCLIKVQV